MFRYFIRNFVHVGEVCGQQLGKKLLRQSQFVCGVAKLNVITNHMAFVKRSKIKDEREHSEFESASGRGRTIFNFFSGIKMHECDVCINNKK